MAFSALTNKETSANQFGTQTLFRKIKDNFDALYGVSAGTVVVPNGSFEIDSDADSQPDQWTTTAYTGGTIGLETTSPLEGEKSLKMVAPGGAGNGGGHAESDFFVCGNGQPLIFSLLLKASAANMDIRVVVQYYDEDQVTIGADDTVYSNSATNPTSVARYFFSSSPPATAKYAKVQLIGGFTNSNAGTAYFDAVSLIDGAIDVQEFTATGANTWTKPPGVSDNAPVFVEVWGGGASGGKGSSDDPGGGGGGGGYHPGWFQAGDLSATETCTVGAGGAAQTSSDTAGNAGGTSDFGTKLYAYGGGGGGDPTLANNAGGGGGGSGQTVGSVGTATVGGDGGAFYFETAPAGGDGGAAGIGYFAGGGGGDNSEDGGTSVYGGGGGGGSDDTSTAGNGGNSTFGGAGGGGGCGDATTPGSGGTSVHGGNGGAGAYDANNGTAGSQPGGGGGGSETGDSGAGGDGMVRVTTFIM